MLATLHMRSASAAVSAASQPAFGRQCGRFSGAGGFHMLAGQCGPISGGARGSGQLDHLEHRTLMRQGRNGRVGSIIRSIRCN
eukprot:5282088-Prymnesium_polylepis.1